MSPVTVPRRAVRYGGLCAMACIAIVCAPAHSSAAGRFAPPDLDGFTQHSERQADGDGDGVKETRIVQYLNANGDSIVSMSTGSRLWAWSLETRGDDSSVRNYVIRDSDCDGVFDEVYGLDDKFHVPECLESRIEEPSGRLRQADQASSISATAMTFSAA